MIRVIGIGDNVCDKYKDLNTMYPGGQTLNFAVFSKMLGYESAFIGVFGNDPCGKHIVEICNKLHIDISHSRHMDGENAYAIVNLVRGERHFVGSNRGGLLRLNPIELSKKDLDYIKDFQIIHTSDRSYIESQLESLSSLGPAISFDISTTWKEDDKTKDICKNVNFVFMSCSDLDEGEIKRRMKVTYSWGTDIVVATRGAEGSLVYDGESFFQSKPERVETIDSLGAGDAFAAGFTTSFVKHIWGKKDLSKEDYEKYINKSLAIANNIAAKTCLTMGAFGHGIEIL